MVIPPFRVAFWSLVTCLAVVVLLGLTGAADVSPKAEASRPKETPFPPPLPPPTRPDRKTRMRIEALEAESAKLRERVAELQCDVDRHDGLHGEDAARLDTVVRSNRREFDGIGLRIDQGNVRIAALEGYRQSLDVELAALRAELDALASREPVVPPPAEPALLFVPFPQPIVITAERTEPPAPQPEPTPAEPISLRVEIEAVEVPAPQPVPAPPLPTPRPHPGPHVFQPPCDPCDTWPLYGPGLAWPGDPASLRR